MPLVPLWKLVWRLNGSWQSVLTLPFFRTPACDDGSDRHTTTSTAGQAHRLLVQLSGQEKHGEKNRRDADRHGIHLLKSDVITAGNTCCARDQHFLHVVRCTAWVLIHCPLLHSSPVFGCTQQNGLIKRWAKDTVTHQVQKAPQKSHKFILSSRQIRSDVITLTSVYFQLQEKRAEVSETLQGFQDVVQGAKSQATLSCQTLLLESIERHIRNYLAIISRLQIEVASTNTAMGKCQALAKLAALHLWVWAVWESLT